MKGLEGKNVLVTGATSGIGQEMAVKFAQYGANVAINYLRDVNTTSETDEMIHESMDHCVGQFHEHGVNHIMVQADVSKEDEVKRMVAETVSGLGGLDFVINNAGIQIAGESHEIEVSKIQAVLNVNLLGAFMVAKEAISYGLAQGQTGSIVNVTSVHQIIPKPRFVGYSMSKGGMQNMTRTLALEYAGRGIRINAVGPGATVTPINSAWIDDPEKKAAVESHIPMGRAGTSEEMAEAAAFFCSDYSAYTTGQTLYVDGGLTLYPDFRTSWSSE